MLLRSFAIGVLLCLISVVHAEEEAEAAAPGKSKYVDLAPSFVTNFGTSSQNMQFLKADVSLRVASQSAVNIVEANMPLIRHQIVMLLSSQSNESMAQPNNQELVRIEALALTRKVLEAETGSPQVDDLLFTSFVVQR